MEPDGIFEILLEPVDFYLLLVTVLLESLEKAADLSLETCKICMILRRIHQPPRLSVHLHREAAAGPAHAGLRPWAGRVPRDTHLVRVGDLQF